MQVALRQGEAEKARISACLLDAESTPFWIEALAGGFSSFAPNHP